MAMRDLPAVPEELQELYERRKAAIQHAGDWRREAREAYEFRDGNQWSMDDRALLEEQNRPCVTFNRVAPIIDSVTGYEINNRRETRYIPRTIDDRAANSVFTDAAQWVRDRCDAEDEESDAYSDALTTGIGWVVTRVDYDEDPDGIILIERVPPLEMRWDPTARKHNCADANWVMRETWVDVDDLREEYPDASIELGSELEDDSQWQGGEHDASEAWKYEHNQTWYDPRAGKVLLIHYQYRVKETYYQVGDQQSGRIVEFSKERFDRLRNRLDDMGIPYVQRRRFAYYQQVAVGSELLEEGPCPIDDGFSYRAITAHRDEETNVWYGMLRAMKDPQRWANAFFSQAMYVLQANSKGGVMVEETAVQDKRAFEENWANPVGVTYVEDGALTAGRIQPKPQGIYPPQLDRLMNTAIQAIRDVSGVNLELLGMVGAEQPGILEIQRKQAALTILAPMVNSLKRFRKIQGRDLLSFMRRYIPPGTVMRISNRPAVMWQDDDTVKYDVIVDDAPTSPNLKNEVWVTLQNILPAMVRAGVPIPPDIIRFSPLPDTIADQWITYINEQRAAPDIGPLQEQLERAQEELQKLQMENISLKDRREAQMLQIQWKEREAAIDAQIREQEMALSARQQEQELLFKQQMSDADRQAKLLEIQARYETETAKIQAEAEVRLASINMQTESNKELQVINLQHERERRQAEREDKMREEVNPHVEKITGTAERLEKLSEEFREYREEMAKARAGILQYLRSRGGEVAQVAERFS